MKHLLSIVAFVLAANVLLASKTFASATCSPIYNGGATCTNTGLTVEKEVFNPQTHRFVHDLGIADAKYHGNEIVEFEIILTNTTNQNMTNITVQDSFPDMVTFKDGPGTFNKSTNKLTFQVATLVAHHSQVFTIHTQVIPQSEFSDTHTSFCATNTVVAVPSNAQLAQDSSQFCIAKISQSPSTGPEAFGLLGAISLLPLGWKLKKLA